MDIQSCVIIGAGGAGCRAAVEIFENGYNPLILSRAERTVSKTYKAQGGIQAALGEDDRLEYHYEDTMKAGGNVSDPAIVKVLTSQAPEAIKWLIDAIGVEFDKEKDGKFKLSKAGGISKPRILSCKGSAGEQIAIPLWKYVDDLGIETKENTAVIKIEKKDGLFNITTLQGNEEAVIKSHTVVLAAGGAMPEIRKVGKQSVDRYIPDGLELAEMIGAKVVSPSLMQYHPTGVVSPYKLRRLRLPETMRGYGATLRNKDSEEFTDHLATRSEVTAAIVEEIKKGKGIKTEEGLMGVWMHTEEIDKINGQNFTKDNFGKIYTQFLEQGHDLSKAPVLVYPVVHYSLGGVQIDENASTEIEGFFAAGEVTWGVHGNDRLMGNSLLDIFVFGKVAGQSVVQFLRKNGGN